MVEFGAMSRSIPECERKRYYPTYSWAARVARRTYRATRSRMHVYPCKVCGGFHVGASEHKEAAKAKHRQHVVPDIRDELDAWGLDLRVLHID